MKKESAVSRFFAFMVSVRQEIDKVTWPSKGEVVVTTIIVFVLAAVSALIFSLIDTTAFKLIHFVIGDQI